MTRSERGIGKRTRQTAEEGARGSRETTRTERQREADAWRKRTRERCTRTERNDRTEGPFNGGGWKARIREKEKKRGEKERRGSCALAEESIGLKREEGGGKRRRGEIRGLRGRRRVAARNGAPERTRDGER